MAQTGDRSMSAKLRLFMMLMTTLVVLGATGFALAVEADDSSARVDPNEIKNEHGTTTTCAQCHGDQPGSTAPDTMKLVAPVPQMCSACHEKYASLDGWVHGPLATGDCLFCHAPHASVFESLLTEPMPGLCYDCHTQETLKLVKGHADQSYGRCDACHESHAGTNRRLLKQTFLESEVGAPYIDVMPARPYALVDQRESLAGLRGIRIIPAIERESLLSGYGVTAEIVKTEVEKHLRERGIKILSDEGPGAGQSGLHVCLRLVELRFPGYSNQVCALSGSLAVSLRQTVELVAQPSDAERRLCFAATWDTSAVVVWGLPQIQEGLHNAIGVLVDKFCADYLQVNPNDEQPASQLKASGVPEPPLSP